MTICAWVIYLMLIVFAGNSEGCTVSNIAWLFSAFAWIAGILSAPPLIYGLARLVFWPNGEKNKLLSVGIVAGGAAIFVTAATLVAMAVSQYGCA